MLWVAVGSKKVYDACLKRNYKYGISLEVQWLRLSLVQKLRFLLPRFLKATQNSQRRKKSCKFTWCGYIFPASPKTRGSNKHPRMCHAVIRNQSQNFDSLQIMISQKSTNSLGSSVQSLSCVQLFLTPWTAARQDSLSITNSWSLLKLMSIELVIPSNRLILCHPFSSCLQSFSASGSFPMSQFFTSSGQSIGASASVSVLPMNIQDWFPLGWTGLISLQSKALARIYSNTTVQKHQFFRAQLSL